MNSGALNVNLSLAGCRGEVSSAAPSSAFQNRPVPLHRVSATQRGDRFLQGGELGPSAGEQFSLAAESTTEVRRAAQRPGPARRTDHRAEAREAAVELGDVQLVAGDVGQVDDEPGPADVPPHHHEFCAHRRSDRASGLGYDVNDGGRTRELVRVDALELVRHDISFSVARLQYVSDTVPNRASWIYSTRHYVRRSSEVHTSRENSSCSTFLM